MDFFFPSMPVSLSRIIHHSQVGSCWTDANDEDAGPSSGIIAWKMMLFMWYFALAFCVWFMHFNCEATKAPNKSSSSLCSFAVCGWCCILSHMLFKLSPTDLIISSWIFSILLCLFLRVNVSFVCLGCFAEDSALLFSSTPSIKLSCSVVRRGESEKAPEESDGYFFPKRNIDA